MEKDMNILSDLKKHLLERYDDSIKEVILFGSRINGNVKEFSDYDILIIIDGAYSAEDENEILDLCYDIDLQYDILLDVHLLSTTELNSLRGKQTVFAHAIKKGIYAQ